MSKDFTRKEVEYLRSVPAVKKVAKNRITYARAFQLYCMARYLRGDGPTAIFRGVGLDPDVVGRKRIERCIARWKTTKSIVDEAARIDANASGEDGVDAAASGQVGCIDAKSVLDSYDIANAAFAAISTSKSGREMFDVRDLIIYQQVQQITALQEKVAELQRRIEHLTDVAAARNVATETAAATD